MTSSEYHYRHLKSLLDNEQIDYCNFDELSTKDCNSDYNVVIIIDFITHNDDLKNNCKLIAEYFTKKMPYIGYYSMIKEYTGEEIERFYKKTKPTPKSAPIGPPAPPPNLQNSDDKNLKFVKDMLSKVNKHSYFAYTAITNTLIGSAGGSRIIKPIWLKTPDRYHIELERDAKSKLICKYTTDGKSSYNEIELKCDPFSLEDVSLFTYKLFTVMGVFELFKKFGENAINEMNNKGYLAHH